MQAAKQVQSSSKEGNCFRRNDQNDVCLSTGTTPSCMEVTFNRFFPSKINDFAHWHENPRQIFAFFSALSPTFPLSSNQMPHGQNIHFTDRLIGFIWIFHVKYLRDEENLDFSMG